MNETLLGTPIKRTALFMFSVSVAFTMFYWFWVFNAHPFPLKLVQSYPNPDRYYFLLYIGGFIGIIFFSATLLLGMYMGWYLSRHLTIRAFKWSALIFPLVMIVGFGLGIYEFNSLYVLPPDLVKLIFSGIPFVTEGRFWSIRASQLSTCGAIYTEFLAMFLGSLIFLAIYSIRKRKDHGASYQEVDKSQI